MADEAYAASAFLVLREIKALAGWYGVVPRRGITLDGIEAIVMSTVYYQKGKVPSVPKSPETDDEPSAATYHKRPSTLLGRFWVTPW